MVIIPGADGLFGVLPGHVPIITELKPGVVTVQVDNTVDRYFVSSGFAFVHPDSSTEVCALEAVNVSELDADAIRVGLEGAKSSLASASDGDDFAELSSVIFFYLENFVSVFAPSCIFSINNQFLISPLQMQQKLSPQFLLKLLRLCRMLLRPKLGMAMYFAAMRSGASTSASQVVRHNC